LSAADTLHEAAYAPLVASESAMASTIVFIWGLPRTV
jgi:hypothetical protein